MIRLHELILDGDDWFFTMDLVRGSDLVTYLRSSGSAAGDLGFDEGKLRACLRQLALGLVALHRAGKIHRDVKPQNVLVTPAGHLTLLDFGLITYVAPHEQSADSHIVGTPAYMSPEQAAARRVVPASDWYSVGVLLYEVLMGRRPLAGSARRVLAEKQAREPPPPRTVRPEIPADLDALCADLLRIDPGARPSGAEILERLGVREVDIERTAATFAPGFD